MRIKSLAQGENILMLGIEPSTFVSKINILTTTPIVHNLQLIETLQEWSCMVDKGEACDILYLDYSKAFDTVSHERLLKKLEAVGITGKILNWIDNFLYCRQKRVVVEGACSSWNHVGSGVPQGSVFDPVLFLIYINDLPKCVSCRIRMFADDTKCF